MASISQGLFPGDSNLCQVDKNCPVKCPFVGGCAELCAHQRMDTESHVSTSDEDLCVLLGGTTYSHAHRWADEQACKPSRRWVHFIQED